MGLFVDILEFNGAGTDCGQQPVALPVNAGVADGAARVVPDNKAMPAMILLSYPRSSAASCSLTDASASLAPSPRSGGCVLWSPRTAGRLLPACGRCSCRCQNACGARALRAGSA